MRKLDFKIFSATDRKKWARMGYGAPQAIILQLKVASPRCSSRNFGVLDLA